MSKEGTFQWLFCQKLSQATSSQHLPGCSSGLPRGPLWKGLSESFRYTALWRLVLLICILLSLGPHSSKAPWSQSWSKALCWTGRSLKETEHIGSGWYRWCPDRQTRQLCLAFHMCWLYISLKSLVLLRSNLKTILSSEFQINHYKTLVSTYCSFEIWVKNYTTIYIYIYSHFVFFLCCENQNCNFISLWFTKII